MIRTRWRRRSCPTVPGGSSGGGDGARRPHAPGVWLIYFTIASLALFALGQWLVPAVQEDRRAWLFLYFLAYIASGMGLLLATSFLNLRRYLRRRKLKMPAAMTATWLTTGAVMIVGLTLAAAVLPVPLSTHAGRPGLDPRVEQPSRLEVRSAQGQRRPGRRGPERGAGGVEGPGQQQTVGQGPGFGEE